MFDTVGFLKDQFGGVDGVVGLVERHRSDAPNREAVRKWFSRRQVPSEWWPVLIVVLEKESGAPVALTSYVHSGGKDDIFA